MEKAIDELRLVNQEIKDLENKKTEFKKKKKNGTITDDEEVEWEDIPEKLVRLENDKEYWKGLVKSATKKKGELESRTFEKADEEFIASVTGVNTRTRKWAPQIFRDNIFPSQRFRDNFEEIAKVFHMRNEAGRRIYLNLFLSDIVAREEFDGALRIFPELDMEVINGVKQQKLSGKADYTIGYGKDMNIFGRAPPTESHLVAIEAKCQWGIDDLWQCVAEAATLYRTRKDLGKARCSVWGVLSNARLWQFIHIDEDGLLWQTKEMNLDIPEYEEGK
ncbi:hypothetical protein HDU91_005832, partial [Kappamyces sp. JEL0680]